MLKIINIFTSRQNKPFLSKCSELMGIAKYSDKPEPVSEALLMKTLKERFPEAKSIAVEDTSGGCGAMFNIFVETKEFQGLSVMKQHRKVYDALKEEIGKIHGLHLETKTVK